MKNDKVKSIVIISFLLLLGSYGFGQEDSSSLSNQTKRVIVQIDTLLTLDLKNRSQPTLEFKFIGEASRVSKRYILYTKLVEVSTNKELLFLMNDTNQFTAIRGYAFMAYLIHMESDLNFSDKNINYNYNYNIPVQIGCVIRTYTFEEFKNKLHKRPNLYHQSGVVSIDKEEKQAIEVENKIREEQGITKRKTDEN